MEETFQIIHVDNFAGSAFPLGCKPTLRSAVRLVKAMYKGRMKPEGKDQVLISDKDGKVVRKFKVE